MKKQLLFILVFIFLNNVAVKASELDQENTAKDLSEVLKKQRMIPNRDPNTGEINGYRVLDMKSGSTFQQSGLQRMDVIKDVNGKPVDSVQKAMELYDTLKMKNKTKLQVEREGQLNTFEYQQK